MGLDIDLAGFEWLWPAAIGVYALSVVVFIALERRRPASTLAWMLVLILLPVVGLPIYLLLGRRRVRSLRKRRRSRSVRPYEAMREMANVEVLPDDLPPRGVGLVRLALRTAGAPIRRAQTVRLIPRTDEAFVAMFDAVEAARHRIHVEFYIWRDDEAGRELVAALAEAAKRGVEVRVLYDDIGSFSTPRKLFDPIRRAGGQAEAFGRFSWRWTLRRGARLDFRNHRKLLSIDGQVGFLGGLNVGNEYRQRLPNGLDWRDLWLRIDGDAVLGIESTFFEDWQATTDEIIEPLGGLSAEHRIRLEDHPDTEATSTGPLVQLIPSGPDLLTSSAMVAQFIAAISIAQQRCWICTPYFIPETTLSLLLRTAALRGVDVRICVPTRAHNDAPLVSFAAQSYYDELLEAGCKIYEFEPGMLHAKYLIVDDQLCAVGSANFDLRSLHINYELTAMFYDAAITEELAEIFESTLGESKPVTSQSRAEVPRWEGVAEAFARILSPLF